MGIMKTIVMSMLFSLFAVIPNVFAAWQGPIEIISANWGSNPGQIGKESSDIGDLFSKSFGVSESGRIVVADYINEVLHVFSSDGALLRDIKNPTNREGWPYTVDAVNGECAVVGYVEFTHTFNIETGDFVGVANNMGGADYISGDCLKIYVKRETWKVYSPTGELLRTETERPLELGRVTKKRISATEYKAVIKYPDKEWVITGTKVPVVYQRDMNGNLYANQRSHVIRYDEEGKEIARVTMPESQFSRTPVTGGVPHPTGYISEVVVEYGDPVIAPNGDVYTWKRTPEKYSIIKWKWQEPAAK